MSLSVVTSLLSMVLVLLSSIRSNPTVPLSLQNEVIAIAQETVNEASGLVAAMVSAKTAQAPTAIVVSPSISGGGGGGGGETTVSQPLAVPTNLTATTSTKGYQWPAMGNVFAASSTSTFQPGGCNTVSFGSTPDLGSIMIGRASNSATPPTGCDDSKGWSLWAVQMDWANGKMQWINPLLDTTKGYIAADGGAHAFWSAYDATVVQYEGTYWVAFECAPVVGWSASSCAGPLIKNLAGQLVIDPSRISIIAWDTFPFGADPHGYATGYYYHSAGVPKLVVFNGSLYMYWDVATMLSPFAPAYTPINFLGSGYTGIDARTGVKRVDVRGAELQVNAATGRLYVKGQSGPISSIDPNNSAEVLTNADAFQVISYNGTLLMTGGLAPGDGNIPECGSPLGSFTSSNPPIPNCYREFFAQSQDPLGQFSLIPDENGIPVNAEEYNRFVYRPTDGRTVLMGGITHTLTYGNDNGANSYVYLWPDNVLQPDQNPPVLTPETPPSAPPIAASAFSIQLSVPTTETELINDLYKCVLSRSPDSGGMATYQALITKGVTLENLYAIFFGSTEYLKDNVSDGRFVTQLYNCFLFRQPDTGGYANWLNALTSGQLSRTDEINKTLKSKEFLTNIVPKLEAIPGTNLSV